jgi:hypothetical protein
MTLIGECHGWHMETELLSYWQEYRHLSPRIPSQNRFKWRRRNLMQAINLIRQVILRSLDLTLDTHCPLAYAHQPKKPSLGNNALINFTA